MEDLIQNAHTLFDEGLSWLPPLSPLSDVAGTPSSNPYTSPLFLSPEMPQFGAPGLSPGPSNNIPTFANSLLGLSS